MSSKETPTREIGRPRQFSDDDVFEATARAVSQYGYRGLTVAAVAQIVGCTGPALIHRFGSKHGLLRSYLEWSTAQSHERFKQIREQHSSPIEALRMRFVLPTEGRPDEAVDDAGHTAYMIFFVEGRGDSSFRPLIDRHAEDYEQEIARLLDDAQAAGEISQVDSKELAHALLVVIAGVNLMWSPDWERPLTDEIGRVFDTVLLPYRMS
jgi:TetR/AcrR family transcriptional regulator, transcriptional repressor for nem operon